MNHVAFIVDSLTGGGAERSVTTSATEIAARGIDVSILTLGDEVAYALDLAIRYVRLSTKRAGMPGNRILARRLRTAMAGLEEVARSIWWSRICSTRARRFAAHNYRTSTIACIIPWGRKFAGPGLANPPTVDDAVLRRFAIETVTDQYLALPDRVLMAAARQGNRGQ